MTQVTIHEAKTHLSRLIKKVMLGEEIVISNRNQPVARLVSEKPDKRTNAIGALRGIIRYEAPDCWKPEEYEDSPNDPVNGAADSRKSTKRVRARKAR